jgi:hypothetical protein
LGVLSEDEKALNSVARQSAHLPIQGSLIHVPCFPSSRRLFIFCSSVVSQLHMGSSVLACLLLSIFWAAIAIPHCYHHCKTPIPYTRAWAAHVVLLCLLPTVLRYDPARLNSDRGLPNATVTSLSARCRRVVAEHTRRVALAWNCFALSKITARFLSLMVASGAMYDWKAEKPPHCYLGLPTGGGSWWDLHAFYSVYRAPAHSFLSCFHHRNHYLT